MTEQGRSGYQWQKVPLIEYSEAQERLLGQMGVIWEAAECRGLPLFFSSDEQLKARGMSQRIADAARRTVCQRCAVQAECLNYALVFPEPYGFWGGLNKRQREQLLRDRKVIEINGSAVTETYEEFAVEIEDGAIIECDTRTEAETIAAQFGTAVLWRRIYVTAWSEQ